MATQESTQSASEVWRPVVGYEGLYEVSDAGRVRSTTYIRAYRNSRRTGKVLALRTNQGGYRTVRMCRDAKERTFPVHRLVLDAFVRVKQPGEQCCHGDGDKTNNALSNLRWGTSVENGRDKVKHGTQARGQRHPRAVLDDQSVREIHARLLAGERAAHLARKFGVSRGMVSHIKHGRRRVA